MAGWEKGNGAHMGGGGKGNERTNHEFYGTMVFFLV